MSKRLIIFSAELDGLDPRINNIRTANAINTLDNGGSYTILHGMYKDTLETSILTDQVDVGIRLARQFGQEYYIERGHYGYWYLIKTETDRVVQTFKSIQEVDRDTALSNGYYTMYNDKYYIGVM
jgi:hypothetical protein